MVRVLTGDRRYYRKLLTSNDGSDTDGDWSGDKGDGDGCCCPGVAEPSRAEGGV